MPITIANTAVNRTINGIVPIACILALSPPQPTVQTGLRELSSPGSGQLRQLASTRPPLVPRRQACTGARPSQGRTSSRPETTIPVQRDTMPTPKTTPGNPTTNTPLTGSRPSCSPTTISSTCETRFPSSSSCLSSSSNTAYPGFGEGLGATVWKSYQLQHATP
jgi:hypothetical protein